MKIQINNQSGLANKYIRWIKWKTYRTKRKFDQLLYAEIYITQEGQNPSLHHSVIKLGVPGYDIILKNKAESPKELWKNSFNDVVRYLRKHKEKQA